MQEAASVVLAASLKLAAKLRQQTYATSVSGLKVLVPEAFSY